MIKVEPLIRFLMGVRSHLLLCMNTFGSLTQTFNLFFLTLSLSLKLHNSLFFPHKQEQVFLGGDDNDLWIPRNDEGPRIGTVLRLTLDTLWSVCDPTVKISRQGQWLCLNEAPVTVMLFTADWTLHILRGSYFWLSLKVLAEVWMGFSVWESIAPPTHTHIHNPSVKALERPVAARKHQVITRLLFSQQVPQTNPTEATGAFKVALQ